MIIHKETHPHKEILSFFQGVDVAKKLQDINKYELSSFENHGLNDSEGFNQYFVIRYESKYESTKSIVLTSTQDALILKVQLLGLKNIDGVKTVTHRMRSVLKQYKVNYNCKTGRNFANYKIEFPLNSFNIERFKFITRFFLQYFE